MITFRESESTFLSTNVALNIFVFSFRVEAVSDESVARMPRTEVRPIHPGSPSPLVYSSTGPRSLTVHTDVRPPQPRQYPENLEIELTRRDSLDAGIESDWRRYQPRRL